MSLTRLLSIPVLCLAVVGVGFAQNQRPNTPRPGAQNRAAQQTRAKQKANRFIMNYGVELTEGQKAQVKQIRQQNAPDPALTKELQGIVASRKSGPLTDAQKARAKAIQDQIKAKQKAAHDQVMNVYTPEQKAQIQKNRDDLQRLQKDIRQLRQQFRQEHPMRLGIKPMVKAGLE